MTFFSCESCVSCNRGNHCYYWSLDSVLCQVTRAENDPMVPGLCKEGLVAVQIVTVTLNIQKLAYWRRSCFLRIRCESEGWPHPSYQTCPRRWVDAFLITRPTAGRNSIWLRLQALPLWHSWVFWSQKKREETFWRSGREDRRIWSLFQSCSKEHQQNPTENLDKLLGCVLSVQLFRAWVC